VDLNPLILTLIEKHSTEVLLRDIRLRNIESKVIKHKFHDNKMLRVAFDFCVKPEGGAEILIHLQFCVGQLKAKKYLLLTNEEITFVFQENELKDRITTSLLHGSDMISVKRYLAVDEEIKKKLVQLVIEEGITESLNALVVEGDKIFNGGI
jgi:hypothetical protein